jgi:hypothetical protein
VGGSSACARGTAGRHDIGCRRQAFCGNTLKLARLPLDWSVTCLDIQREVCRVNQFTPDHGWQCQTDRCTGASMLPRDCCTYRCGFGKCKRERCRDDKTNALYLTVNVALIQDRKVLVFEECSPVDRELGRVSALRSFRHRHQHRALHSTLWRKQILLR